MTDKPPMREMTIEEYARWRFHGFISERAEKEHGIKIVDSHEKKKPELNVVPLKAKDEDH